MGRLNHDQEQFFYSFRLDEAVLKYAAEDAAVAEARLLLSHPPKASILYLSTVSGGGYIGTRASCAPGRLPEWNTSAQLPFILLSCWPGGPER